MFNDNICYSGRLLVLMCLTTDVSFKLWRIHAPTKQRDRGGAVPRFEWSVWNKQSEARLSHWLLPDALAFMPRSLIGMEGLP